MNVPAQPVTTATCLSWIPQSSSRVSEMDERRGAGERRIEAAGGGLTTERRGRVSW